MVFPDIRFGSEVVRTSSVIAQFGVPGRTVFDQLRLELMIPRDEAARAFFVRLAEVDVGA